jgi:PAS domain S-box-containing protein
MTGSGTFSADESLLAQVRASERRLSLLIQESPLAYLEVDTELRVVQWNRSAELLFGYSRDEALGRSVEELIFQPEERREATATFAAFASQVSGRRSSAVHVTKFGQKLQCEWYYTPLKDDAGHMTGLAIMVRDITERKRAETELRQAKEAAEAASRAKSEFLSRMSHELRTPLNAVLGFAQLLQMEQLTPLQREFLGHILTGGKHLLFLINEILDISRIETGRLSLTLHAVPVAELVQETLELIRPLADGRDVRLATRLGPLHDRCVRTDRQRLKQVLLNLFSNAVKYNRPGGSVTVIGEVPAPGRLCLAVQDTGIGIAPENLGRLFEPFQRLGAEATREEGMGLGLALSKRLVDALGGSLTVTSLPGEGSTFRVELPQADPDAGEGSDWPAQTQVPAVAGSAPRTVLLVEDHLTNAKLIEQMLTHRPGIRLVTATDGRTGFERARLDRPDLILLDVHLPDLSGDQFLHALQADPWLRDIPVVAVSADATAPQVQRLLAAGAREYLTKPLDVPRFLEVVDSLLARPTLDRSTEV